MRVPGIPFVQGRNDYTDHDGKKYGVAIHNTSNDASAEGEASYAQRRTDGISAHFYVDQDSVIQSLDTADRAGHAGSSEGNDHAIAVEITGVNGWSRATWLSRVAWAKLGAVLAAVCKHHGIPVRRVSVSEMSSNPKARGFYSHNDMRLAWGGTTHTDPGPGFPWDRLFEAVNAALTGEDNDMDAEQEAKVIKGSLTEDNALYYWLRSIVNGTIPSTGPAGFNWDSMVAAPWPGLKQLGAQLTALRTEVAALAGKDMTDEPAIIAGVLAGLSPEAIAAAIPTDLAQRVADELAARLQG